MLQLLFRVIRIRARVSTCPQAPRQTGNRPRLPCTGVHGRDRSWLGEDGTTRPAHRSVAAAGRSTP